MNIDIKEYLSKMNINISAEIVDKLNLYYEMIVEKIRL